MVKGYSLVKHAVHVSVDCIITDSTIQHQRPQQLLRRQLAVLRREIMSQQ
jgi:hypothetical protein